MTSASPFFELEDRAVATLLRLISEDGTNRLTRACVLALTDQIIELAEQPRPLIITGNDHFFSAGADLNEIAELNGPEAYEFAKLGQRLMQLIEDFPFPVCAAIHAYCMGGGLDLALACHLRIAHPRAIFGHRGAALGLITGWGGTQRLSRLIGKSRALKMFVAAEKPTAAQALDMGLISCVSEHPIAETIRILEAQRPDPDQCSPA
ncbi:MAG TPA: enoyl-CoA hydratase/isomerase family protein [Terriglobales bacterium]|nr:enoyl-CoA hydratase/isomerase family protein [Terriglobales bacterium]